MSGKPGDLAGSFIHNCLVYGSDSRPNTESMVFCGKLNVVAAKISQIRDFERDLFETVAPHNNASNSNEMIGGICEWKIMLGFCFKVLVR